MAATEIGHPIGEGGLTVKGGSIRIEAGGQLHVDGDATFNGSLTVPAGSLNTAGDITAGDDVIAGDTVQGAHVVGTADVTAPAIAASGQVSGATGVFNGGLKSTDVHSRLLTYGGAYTATYCHVDGTLGHVPSSRRFKRDEQPAELDPAAVLALQMVSFRYTAAVEELGDDADTEIGLIAEDVHALGLTWLVNYDADGAPLGIRYERLALALLPLVQTLAADVAALKAAVNV